jgi:hypothetical protein
MNSCYWEVVNGFNSPGEFKRFYAWLSGQVDAGVVENIPVTEPTVIFGLEERWYRCKESGEIWQLVAPQAPFDGYWGPVRLKRG